MLKALRLWWHARSTRRKMERVFSRGADPYAYESSPYERARFSAMKAALGPGPFRSVLEVGCAEGIFTEHLASLAERVTALDISATALGRARSRLKEPSGVTLIEGDVRLWEPPSEPFDAVILGDVLYYLDKPWVQEEFESIFVRVERWLAPGGALLLAHGFAGSDERDIREGYRRRFETLGLRLKSETTAGDGESQGPVRCLVSLLIKPSNTATISRKP